MFWIFRKRKPMKPAHFYLDAAAGVLQARGKCEGKTYDDWGRVDVMGAIRIAVWGVVGWDDLPRKQRVNRHLYWDKYDETKMLLYRYLAENYPNVNWSSDKSWMNTRLQKWSDTTSQHAAVEWMKRAANAERRGATYAPTKGV